MIGDAIYLVGVLGLFLLGLVVLSLLAALLEDYTRRRSSRRRNQAHPWRRLR